MRAADGWDHARWSSGPAGNHGNTKGVRGLVVSTMGPWWLGVHLGVLGGVRWLSVEAWAHRVDRAETCWQG